MHAHHQCKMSAHACARASESQRDQGGSRRKRRERPRVGETEGRALKRGSLGASADQEKITIEYTFSLAVTSIAEKKTCCHRRCYGVLPKFGGSGPFFF